MALNNQNHIVASWQLILDLKITKNKYKFGRSATSLGTISTIIPIKGYKVLIVNVDVVTVDVPFLIGSDFGDYKTFLNTIALHVGPLFCIFPS